MGKRDGKDREQQDIAHRTMQVEEERRRNPNTKATVEIVVNEEEINEIIESNQSD